MDTLNGAVERITYYNPENGYTVLRLQGQRDNHPKYGPQFKAEVCEQTQSATALEWRLENS